MVLLSGDAGIGKSRLVQILKDHVAKEPHTRWDCRSSPYFEHTALFPLTDLFQRLLRFQAEDTPHEKLAKLAQMLSQYRVPLGESVERHDRLDPVRPERGEDEAEHAAHAEPDHPDRVADPGLPEIAAGMCCLCGTDSHALFSGTGACVLRAGSRVDIRHRDEVPAVHERRREIAD